MTDTSSQPAFLAGLIGSGIQASRTPSMHEREGTEQGVRYIYKIIDIDKLGLGVEALPELLTAAQRMGFNGLNITYPCKQAIIPLLDELSDDARQLGAVNTVVFKDGRSYGHNTDWWGFAEGPWSVGASISSVSVGSLNLPPRPPGRRSISAVISVQVSSTLMRLKLLSRPTL